MSRPIPAPFSFVDCYLIVAAYTAETLKAAGEHTCAHAVASASDSSRVPPLSCHFTSATAGRRNSRVSFLN